MQTTQRVLFSTQHTHYNHTETVRSLLEGKPIPDGGPFCICSPKAICALKEGTPVECKSMPWKCPLAAEIESTPTT